MFQIKQLLFTSFSKYSIFYFISIISCLRNSQWYSFISLNYHGSEKTPMITNVAGVTLYHPKHTITYNQSFRLSWIKRDINVINAARVSQDRQRFSDMSDTSVVFFINVRVVKSTSENKPWEIIVSKWNMIQKMPKHLVRRERKNISSLQRTGKFQQLQADLRFIAYCLPSLFSIFWTPVLSNRVYSKRPCLSLVPLSVCT